MRRQSRKEALGNFGDSLVKIVGVIIIGIAVINFTGNDDDNSTTTVNRPSEEKVTAIPPVKKTYETYDYEDITRAKDGMEGNHITISGKVVEVVKRSSRYIARVASNGDSNEMFYVKIPEEILDYNLLDDDYITVDGTLYGIEDYRSVLGGQISIPGVDADSVELIE